MKKAMFASVALLMLAGCQKPAEEPVKEAAKLDEKATAVRNGFMARLPLGRLGEPEDLVGVLLFLSSSASDFCTGQTMFVDGGYTAG